MTSLSFCWNDELISEAEAAARITQLADSQFTFRRDENALLHEPAHGHTRGRLGTEGGWARVEDVIGVAVQMERWHLASGGRE